MSSDSKACNSSLKSTNSPAVAAVANRAGMEGMEPLKGASWGRVGKMVGCAVEV